MPLSPLKFKPLYKERPWGSRKLQAFFGKNLPPGKKIGESWELADLPDDKTVVASGPYAGLTLAAVVEREGERLTGWRVHRSPFPLLIKLLDCADVLSVQVHPDEAACRRMGKGDFKTECCYIIQADEGACLYKGLRAGVTRERFAEAIRSRRVEELLARVTVKAGECHLLPAGTPHALGGGLLVAEIETPSDTTYRVFDWNRVDERGRPRPLHVPEALESIHFDAAGDDLSVRTDGLLAACSYFRVEKKQTAAGRPERFAAGRMSVLVVLAGSGEIAGAGPPVAFRAGDTILVPAAFGGELAATGTVSYLAVTIPR